VGFIAQLLFSKARSEE